MSGQVTGPIGIAATGGGHTPVVLDDFATHSAGSTVGFTATNITVGTGLVNGILVALVVMGSNAAPPGAMTVVWDLGGTNQAMTAVPGSPATNGNQSIFGFYLLNPTAGNNILSISATGGAATMSVVAGSYQNASGVANFTSTTGGTPQQVTVTAGVNDAVFGAFSSNSNFSSTGVTQIDIDNTEPQWAIAWQRSVGPNPTLVGNPGDATSLSAGFAITAV